MATINTFNIESPSEIIAKDTEDHSQMDFANAISQITDDNDWQLSRPGQCKTKAIGEYTVKVTANEDIIIHPDNGILMTVTYTYEEEAMAQDEISEAGDESKDITTLRRKRTSTMQGSAVELTRNQLKWLEEKVTSLDKVKVLTIDSVEDISKESLKLCNGALIEFSCHLQSAWWIENIQPENASLYGLDHNGNENDNDSTMGSDMSEVTYAGSDIFDVVEENGRTYHKYKEGKYLLPNDERETERLDLQHEIFGLSLQRRLYLAPIGAPHRVLDVGTGTGVWACDFAIQHPVAKVTGTDLSPIQNTRMPNNVEFEIDDAEARWLFQTPFDYVHIRMSFTYFTPHIVYQAFEHLCPAGFLELQDPLFPFKSSDPSFQGSEVDKWGNLLVEAAQKLGKDWRCATKYPEYLKNAGFIELHYEYFDWPIGLWDSNRQDVGRKCGNMVWDWLEPLSMACLTRSGIMTFEEVQLLLVGVRNELRNPDKLRAYIRMVVVYGRKP